jgi:hypothetical protein
MTIHHATLKKADKLGIKLTEVETTQGTFAQAGDFLHPKAKTALAAAEVQRQLASEYPALRLRQVDDEDYRFRVTFTDDAGEHEIVAAQDDVPSLADVLDATTAQGFDPEAQDADDAEEEKESGTVVNPRYRALYKERGNPNHCGDWLAQQLDGRFQRAVEVVKPQRDGSEEVETEIRFDPESFIEFLRENEVDLTGRWAELPNVGTPGWQGRFRMNGRQRLEKIVAHRGNLVLDGKVIDLPQEELDRLRAKHPEPKKRKKAMTQEAQEAA